MLETFRKEVNDVIVKVVDKLFKGDIITELVYNQTTNISKSNTLHDNLINFLLSLPDVYANKIKPPER